MTNFRWFKMILMSSYIMLVGGKTNKTKAGKIENISLSQIISF